jgi:KaiC/GvpD/RAD55 family RecA-like ATPase
MGKSTFAINMTAGFLHTGQKVLYVGNEDNINVLKARMRNRLARMTPDEVERDPATANKIAREKAGDRLIMRHLHRGRVDDLQRAVEDFRPTVLVVDQLRNIDGKGDNLTQKLDRASVEVRRLLATYGLIGVSVTQAYPGEHDKDSKVMLTMDDVESSRTGIPAQADLLVGIGASSDMIARNERYLSIPKNKLNSADDAKQGLLVSIDKKRAIYT